MCDPVSIGLGIVAGIGAGANLYGGLSRASAIEEEGRFAESQANRNAALLDFAARDARQRGERDAATAGTLGEAQASQIARQAAAVRGEQIATAAGSGFDLSSRSMVDLITGSAAAAEVDKAAARNNAAREAWGIKSDAAREAWAQEERARQMRAEGRRIRSKAEKEAFSTRLGGAVQFVGSAANIAAPGAGGLLAGRK